MAEMGVGRYLLCSKGNFTSVLEFHGSTSGPGFSYAALPGKCVKGNVAKGAQTITVHGWGKDGKAFQINKAEVLAFPLNKDGTQAAGLKFFTDGTVKKHTWYFKR
ncbi:hypothetical protein C8E86_5564 [Catellatospora citrea]|nr:hypothetical protein C8E86_5564 [Catellatospora citrea]